MKYKIGDTIRDTDAFGTVVVLDVFTSTKGQWCYHVHNIQADVSFLCWEGELVSGAWSSLT